MLGVRTIWIVPVIVSILIIGILGLSQDVFAVHGPGHHPFTFVTPDRESGPVNQLQSFSVQFTQSGDVLSSQLSISCDPPIQVNFNPNIQNNVPQSFTAKSDTPGIFICEARIDGDARATGDARARPMLGLAIFIPVFNSLAPDTIITEVKDFTKDILLQSGDSVLTQGTTAKVQFSFTGTDDVGVQSISCKSSGDSSIVISNCSSPKTINLQLGTHTFSFQAFDGFNLDPTPAEFEVTVLKDTDGDGIADNVDPSPGIVSQTFKVSSFLSGLVSGNTNSFSGYPSSLGFSLPDFTPINVQSFKWQSSSTPSIPKPSFSMPSFSMPKISCSGFSCSISAGIGSSIVQVDNGIAEVEFEATDGRLAFATIEAGNTIIFDPDEFTFAGALDNKSPVNVIADGQPLVVSVGPDLTQLIQLVADLQAENDNLNNVVIPALEQQLTDKDAEITQLTADLAQSQADLAAVQAERDTALSDLAAAIAERNQALADLFAAQAERDQALADLAVAQADITDLEAILLSGEITICHNGKKTQTISLAAYGTHVGHGDTRGPC